MQVERQLTARGPAPTSRSQAWAAWEAAVVEFNKIFAPKREEKRKKTKFELALLRRKFDLVAVEKFPNREVIMAVPLGQMYPEEIGVIGTGCRKWWEFEISPEFPELRQAQFALFAETGVPPKEIELGLSAPPVPGFDKRHVSEVFKTFCREAGVHPQDTCLEGVAALLSAGVIETSRPGEDTNVEITVFVRKDEPVPDLTGVTPPGVRVSVVRDFALWHSGRIGAAEVYHRHPQLVLKEMLRTGQKGYIGAIRAWNPYGR